MQAPVSYARHVSAR